MKMINLFRLFVLFALCLSGAVFAEPGKVLVVNSDNTVYRYQVIAAEFKKVLKQNAYSWTDLNLDRFSDADAETELKRIIELDDPVYIYCIGTKAFSLAREHGQNRKLFFSAAINWRRLAIADETYGVANELSTAQELSLLRYFFPGINKIGMLYSDAFSREYVETVKKDAQSLGIEIVNKTIKDPKEIAKALDELLPRVDMLWLISDPVVLSSKQSVRQIFQSAQRHNKPVYAYSDVFIEQGAVLSIAPDIATIGRQSANLIMLVDENKVPAGTVQSPAGSTVTLNKCTLDALKLNFNQDALDSVNKIVGCDK